MQLARPAVAANAGTLRRERLFTIAGPYKAASSASHASPVAGAAVRSLQSIKRADRLVTRFVKDGDRASAAAAASGTNVTTKVKFEVVYEAQFGTQLGVVGNVPELGGPGWSPDACLTLEWSDGHVWSGVVELSTTHAIEFKLVLLSGSGPERSVTWEQGPNRVMVLPPPAGPATLLRAGHVSLTWGQPGEAYLEVKAAPAEAKAATAAAAALAHVTKAPEAVNNVQVVAAAAAAAAAAMDEPLKPVASVDTPASPQSAAAAPAAAAAKSLPRRRRGVSPSTAGSRKSKTTAAAKSVSAAPAAAAEAEEPLAMAADAEGIAAPAAAPKASKGFGNKPAATKPPSASSPSSSSSSTSSFSSSSSFFGGRQTNRHVAAASITALAADGQEQNYEGASAGAGAAEQQAPHLDVIYSYISVDDDSAVMEAEAVAQDERPAPPPVALPAAGIGAATLCLAVGLMAAANGNLPPLP